MGVDWLDIVTSVVYLGGMGVNLLDNHFSRKSGGTEVDWLDTFTSIVYLGGMRVDWLDTVTSVVYLGV
jgi:hypothetical protein